MAMAISSAKPMPTKPPVASVSPSRMSFTASAAETTLPFSSRLRNGRAGWSIVGSSALALGRIRPRSAVADF